MKKDYKIYLESKDFELLKEKAEARGFAGKGWLSHYIEQIARTKIAYLDENLKAFLEIINLKPTRNRPN